jgi:hypothetical protein
MWEAMTQEKSFIGSQPPWPGSPSFGEETGSQHLQLQKLQVGIAHLHYLRCKVLRGDKFKLDSGFSF